MHLFSLQWSLLAWMLFCAGAGFLLWNRLFRPRLEGPWALVLLLLALAPMLPALRTGVVYGPFDTNAPFLPWAAAADADYEPLNGRLNDVTLMLVPWQAEARRQMLEGRAPLLNPFSGAGHPLLGNALSAPFSLVSLLSLPFEPLESQALRAFLKLLLALAGTWLAARQLGARPAFCLLAAVAYGWGGSLSVWRLFPQGEVMVLWPLAFLGSERALAERGDWRARLGFGLPLAGILLSGHPETALTACLALAGRWLLAFRYPFQRRAVGVLLLSSLLAALGVSFFILPVAQSVFGSEKLHREGSGRDLDRPLTASGGSVGALLNLAVPGIFGTPQEAGEAGPAPLHWLVEGAVGLPALALALGGLFAAGRRSGTETYLALLAAAGFLPHLDPGGLVRALSTIPLVSVIAFRYFAYLGGFAVALLAARGLERWTAEEGSRRFRIGMAAAVLLAGLTALAAHPLAVRWWAGRPGLADPAVLAESARYGWIAVAAAAGTALVLLSRRFPVPAGLLAATLTAVQLWSALGGYYPVLPRERAYPPVPLLERLASESGPFRIAGTRGVFMPNDSTFYGIQDVRTHDPSQPARYIDWLREMLDVDVNRYHRQYGAPKRQHVPFLRLLGTRYLLSGPNLQPGPPWIDRGLFRQTRLWELPGETRWAFFPETLRPASTARQAWAILHAARHPLEIATVENATGVPARNGQARVLGWRVDVDRLTVRTEAAQDAWMVVSQAAIPGWRARADGHPVPTAIADGALLAVRVPAGTRVVSLRYLPSVWIAGLVLSGAAWIASALLLWKARAGYTAPGKNLPFRDPVSASSEGYP
jgi:hypothetical protein